MYEYFTQKMSKCFNHITKTKFLVFTISKTANNFELGSYNTPFKKLLGITKNIAIKLSP